MLLDIFVEIFLSMQVAHPREWNSGELCYPSWNDCKKTRNIGLKFGIHVKQTCPHGIDYNPHIGNSLFVIAKEPNKFQTKILYSSLEISFFKNLWFV